VNPRTHSAQGSLFHIAAYKKKNGENKKMLHLYKVTYEKINDKELPKELFDLYGMDWLQDEIMFYVLAENNSEASEMAWLSLPVELEDYFEETSNNDIQSPYIDDDFIDNYQNELKMTKDEILKINGYLNDKEKEYFDTYLETK
jgi:hypothetical protein